MSYVQMIAIIYNSLQDEIYIVLFKECSGKKPKSQYLNWSSQVEKEFYNC